MRPGQPAEIKLDAYPHQRFCARVSAISPGTGSAFSLLPPENATGNWVKVVQRVPVKIVLNQPAPPDKPLRMGLSVEVTVDIANTTGPLLTSTLQNQYQSGNGVHMEGGPENSQGQSWPPAGDETVPVTPDQPAIQH
jgi:multidrug resistance efflux pump